MRKLLAALAFTAIIASPGLAADPAPPLDSHRAAALDVLEATNAHNTVVLLGDTLTPLMLAQVKRQHPDASD